MSNVKNTDDIKVGVVVSVDDPTKSGRIKVRIPGIHDTFETGELPWVSPPPSPVSSGGGGGMLSIPRVGQTIRVKYKETDNSSLEWVGTLNIDRQLAQELGNDYEGSHTLLYDSEADLSIKFQQGTGLAIYYKGSNIQISPDNTITIHYGSPSSGVNMQLRDGEITMTAPDSINSVSMQSNLVSGRNVKIMGSESVQIKGNKPGECAVNGRALMQVLMTMAQAIDEKVPTGSSATQYIVKAQTGSVLNEKIQYV